MTTGRASTGTLALLSAWGSQTARRHPFALATGLVAVALCAGAVLSGALPREVALHIAPTVAIVFVFAATWLLLQRQIGSNVFGEIGFAYVGLILAYTALPALAFLGAAIYEGGPLADLLPDPSQLRDHLWRHVLFAVSVAAGYLALRGRSPVTPNTIPDATDRDNRAVVTAAVAVLVLIVSLNVMSAPVTNYWEHYQRFDHLPFLLRKISSVFIRMSLGLYCVLLVFLFRNYNKYRFIIPPVVAAICAYEITYSYGARIQALIVLLQAACLYHFLVRRISLRLGLFAVVGIVMVFSVVEVVRVLDFDVASARDAISDEGVRPASELTSVFFPSFHLYAERAAGSMPPRPWPMFFNDFISLVTWGNFTRWNPMEWYHTNYFPQADVSPFTLGPIADSAMWGGEWDLLLRGLLNGAFFAIIMRWFLQYRNRWWSLTIYTYCFATCILTLKYTIFLHLTLIEKNLLPVLMLMYAVRVVRLSLRRSVTTPAVA